MTIIGDDLRIQSQMALTLLEAPGTGDAFNADGTVNVVILRPCDGRGPGGRIYPVATLREAAPTFEGLASYLNHLDPTARRATAKMRRGPDELAGEIREARWDPHFTTPDDHKHGYERGGVIGKYMPATDLVEQLIRRIPNQMKLSINSQAGKLSRAKRKDGSPGWLVESIVNNPETSSVDLVTAAGAGGGVLQLVESLEEETPEVSSSMTLAEALLTPEVSSFIQRIAGGGQRPTIQAWATPAKTAAQQYREDLVSGKSHREAAAEVAERDRPSDAVEEHMALVESHTGSRSPWLASLERRGVDPSPFLAQAKRSHSVQDYLRSRGLDPADYGMAAEPPERGTT